MTPEQLREYAAEKERAHLRLVGRYVGPEAVPPSPLADRETGPSAGKLRPWERDVEFEGVTYRLDVRRVKSMQFMRTMARIQKARARDGEPPLSDVLDMLDQFMTDEAYELACRTVRERMGYEDAEELVRIESALLEALDAKN